MKAIQTTILILIVQGFMTSCLQPPSNEQAEEEMIALTERYIEIWNGGDLGMVDEVCDANFVWHEVDIDEKVVGIEAFKDYVRSTRRPFPDFTVTIDEIIVIGDRTVSLWTITGTNTGLSETSPATGKTIEVSGASISTVRDGKLVEELAYYNQAAMLTQLGYTITPPTVEEEE